MRIWMRAAAAMSRASMGMRWLRMLSASRLERLRRLRLAVYGLGQAMGAVPLTEVELPRSVGNHQEVSIQPPALHRLHADKPVNYRPSQTSILRTSQQPN